MFDVLTAPTTKFKPPRLPRQLLTRQALLRRLADWQEHSLTVIVAPAGYGKTTLAAGLLQAAATQLPNFYPVWLALDEDDDDSVRFVQGLRLALAARRPADAEAALLPGNQPQPRAAMLRLLAALESLPGPVLIVLDDYHRLRTAEVHQLLSTALERTPDNVHWLVLSRHSVPFALGRQRLGGQVLELDSEDLRLSRREIEELLASRNELQLSAASIDLLEERTRGWIAGLHLALLSLQRQAGRDSEPAQASLDTLLHHVSGDNALLGEYLASEVLTHLDEGMRSFLIQCSILDRLHPSLCTLVTGMEESKRCLHQAVEQQLFLRQLEGAGEWYELHHLFREMLLRRLHQELPAAQVQTLYRRAADWWLAQGDLVAALHALLDGGSPSLAAELVQTRSRAALLSDRLDELRHWLELLPPAEIDARLPLLLDKTWLSFLHENTGDFLQTLTRAKERAAALPAVAAAEYDELAALDLVQQMFGSERQGLYDRAIAAARQFAAQSHLARGWAYMVGMIMISQGRNPPVEEYFQQATSSFQSIGFLRGELDLLAVQTIYQYGAGEGAKVLAGCRRGLELVTQQDQPHPNDAASLAFQAGEVLYWQNLIAEAAGYFQCCSGWARRCAEPRYSLVAQICLDLCAAAGWQPADGEILAPRLDEEQLWSEFGGDPDIGMKSIVAQWHMWRSLIRKAPQAAWQHFTRLNINLETLPADAPDAVWLALLTAYVAQGRQLEQLTTPLQHLIERNKNQPMLQITIRAQLLRVRQLHQLGQRDAARSTLRLVLRDVEKSGYVRMVIDQPEILPLLRGISTRFVQELLRLAEMSHAAPALPPLTAQEQAILRMLNQGLRSAQIAEQLVLTVSTVNWHLSTLYRKLGVKNRAQALKYLRERGAI